VQDWFEAEVADDWRAVRERAMFILQKETELQEIVQLVGPDALPETEKLILEVPRMIREDSLQQFAFDAIDAYCPPQKGYWILKTVLAFNDAATQAMSRGVSLRQVMQLPLRDEISTLKTTPHEEALERMPALVHEINEQIAGIEVL
jgi:V/A-type H+-transporting ATPase subunit A